MDNKVVVYLEDEMNDDEELKKEYLRLKSLKESGKLSMVEPIVLIMIDLMERIINGKRRD